MHASISTIRYNREYMKQRMLKYVFYKEVAVEADSCTDESSGDETESTLAPTETTDSESQVSLGGKTDKPLFKKTEEDYKCD